VAALGAANDATAQGSQAQPTPREAARLPLPEPFTGWEARFVEVRYPAGSASPQHRHPGFVLGYVVEGEFRFAINGESPRNLSAGQVFYEPPGALHTVSASARADQPVKILAIIIARNGEQ